MGASDRTCLTAVTFSDRQSRCLRDRAWREWEHLSEAEGEGALASQLTGKPLCTLCPSSVCILVGE